MDLIALLGKIENYLDDVARNEWQRFINESGNIEMDTLALLEEAVESMVMDESLVDALASAVESLEATAAVNRMFLEMELTVKEIAEDAAEWSKAQSHGIPGIMRYHGLAVGDFV